MENNFTHNCTSSKWKCTIWDCSIVAPGKYFFRLFCWAYWWFNKFVFAYSKVWLYSFCNIIAMSICYTQNCTYLILILLCVIFSNHTIRFIHCTTMFVWANQLVTLLMNIINNILVCIHGKGCLGFDRWKSQTVKQIIGI